MRTTTDYIHRIHRGEYSQQYRDVYDGILVIASFLRIRRLTKQGPTYQLIPCTLGAVPLPQRQPTASLASISIHPTHHCTILFIMAIFNMPPKNVDSWLLLLCLERYYIWIKWKESTSYNSAFAVIKIV